MNNKKTKKTTDHIHIRPKRNHVICVYLFGSITSDFQPGAGPVSAAPRSAFLRSVRRLRRTSLRAARWETLKTQMNLGIFNERLPCARVSTVARRKPTCFSPGRVSPVNNSPRISLFTKVDRLLRAFHPAYSELAAVPPSSSSSSPSSPSSSSVSKHSGSV